MPSLQQIADERQDRATAAMATVPPADDTRPPVDPSRVGVMRRASVVGMEEGARSAQSRAQVTRPRESQTTGAPPVAPAATGAYRPGRAVLRDVDTVEERFNRIMDADNPLIRAARTRARQQMNQRGLLNSSIALGAAELAAAQSALPIASQDADATNRARELAARQSFEGEQNQLQRDLSLELQKRGFDENAIQRAFTGEQNEANRELQKLMQERGFDENERARVARSELQLELQKRGFDENAIQRAFTGEQNEANRELQKLMQERGFKWNAEENRLQRDWQSQENTLARVWQSGENQLNRDQQRWLQESQQTWQSGENQLNRDQQRWLQESQQTWQSKENLLSREHQKLMQELDFAGKERLMKVNNALQSAMENLQHGNRMELQRFVADNARLIANNANAAAITQTMISGIATISANPDMTGAAKEEAIRGMQRHAGAYFDLIGVDPVQTGGGGGDGGGGGGGGGAPITPPDNGNPGMDL